MAGRYNGINENPNNIYVCPNFSQIKAAPVSRSRQHRAMLGIGPVSTGADAECWYLSISAPTHCIAQAPLNSIWSIVSDCKIYPSFTASRQIFLCLRPVAGDSLIADMSTLLVRIMMPGPFESCTF